MTAGKYNLETVIMCKTILLAWVANDRERERSVFLPCVNDRRHDFLVQDHCTCQLFTLLMEQEDSEELGSVL